MKSEVSRIEAKINEAIFKQGMLENAETVIIGVSGGADSMALLSFFVKNFRDTLNIFAAHVNHCLRGDESDRDEAFVRNYCEKNAIKLEVLRVNVMKASEDMGQSIEECARTLRYRFFHDLASKYNGRIATAHTLSDSIETMMINLARGTGLSGLCGIAPKRENIIRPFIFLRRAETQAYCEKSGVDFVTDSTNLDREYTRNKIRLDVVPVLKQINPEFEATAARTLSLLKADEEYLDAVAAKILDKSLVSPGVYALNKVKTQPLPILSRFIRLAVFEFLKSNVTAQHVDLILGLIKANRGAVNLPRGITVCVKDNLLTVKKNGKKPDVPQNDMVIPFKAGDLLTENLKKFIIKVLSRGDFENFGKADELPLFCALDYDKIGKNAVFRTRRAGDRFCQAGRGVTKTVKKLFNELKIPQSERDHVLMLVANGNEVLWIDGVGIAECVKVTEDTQKVAIIYFSGKE